MKRPSASNAEAFVRCTASHVLPQHESYHEKTEKGTDGHKLLTDVINRFPGAALRLETAMPGMLSKLNDEMHGVEAAVSEEAYVVDVQARTSILLGTNIDRKYVETLGRALKPFEICCSLDVHGRKGPRRWVRDFKFGIYHSWWQLYIQAMAVLWLPGREDDHEVDAGFTFIEDYGGSIAVTEDTRTLYLSDLDEHAAEMMRSFKYAERLEKMLERGEDVPVTEGKWCQYCGAFPHCPAKWRLAREMLTLDVSDKLGAMSLEECGAAWVKLTEVKNNIIKKMETALKERMRAEGGFPLGEGKMLKVLPQQGRLGFDKEGAIELLKRLGASEDEILPLIKRGDSFDTVRKVNQ